MPAHKLAEGPATLTVVSAEEVKGKFGIQVRFSGEDYTDVYISDTAAARGLARLNLDLESVIGQTLRFSQVKKDGKTYTNIDPVREGAPRAEATEPTTEPAKEAAPRPAAGKRTFEENAALYGQCVDVAFTVLLRKCEENGVPVDASALQAAAATLFIASK